MALRVRAVAITASRKGMSMSRPWSTTVYSVTPRAQLRAEAVTTTCAGASTSICS
jgi:hypothetical protein